LLAFTSLAKAAEWPQYDENPFVIKLNLPTEDDGVGGIIVADADNDGLMDYLAWTVAGVEVIWAIDWTGEEKQLAAAKERHESGDAAVFDPITGRFLFFLFR